MDKKLIREIIFKTVSGAAILGLIFFGSAGTMRFWQAWVYLALLFSFMGFIMLYLLRNDPELLERRMRTGEKVGKQKLIIKLGSFVFLLIFLIPGLDFRYNWSQAPIYLIVIADIVFLFGYYLFFLTLKENSYASRIIEVEKEQKVISTGPYAVVRHPMYTSIVLMIGLTPICLGSYIGFFVSIIPLIIILVLRILNEEKVLSETLLGYKEYLQKTKYRLIPGIW